jgi:dihydrolipoamide dehydrogenase
VIEVDLAIVGAGPAGMAAARAAALTGAAVAITGDTIGGRSLHTGSIARAALADKKVAWSAACAAARERAARYSERATLALEDAGATVLSGRARFVSPNELSNGVRFDRAIIATGARPRALPGQRAVHASELLGLEALPKEALVIGGGTDGAEIVTLLNERGLKVTWVMDELGILPSFDRELADAVGDTLMERGVKLVHGKAVKELTPEGAKLDGGRTYTAPLIVVAAGSTPDLAELDLARAGIERLAYDAHGRTNVAHLFAAGEVAGAHAAAAEAMGRVAGLTAAGESCAPFDAAKVPRHAAVSPEIAQVGLTPDRAAGREVAIHTLRLEETIAGQLAGIDRADRKGGVRVVASSDDGRVLGATALGPHAREIASAAALAISMGATDAELASTFACTGSFVDALYRAAR